MQDAKIGQVVRANYNSGTYIGEVMEDRGNRYLIKVLAVHKHPMQGDLHNPGKIDDIFFHERKALAFTEKMNVAKSAVKPFDEEVPEYQVSLKQAVRVLKDKLSEKDTAYNQKALEALVELERKYY
ncbi:kinase [Virgibacillus phasianinus]|uniref:Kinase n=1 Tax=Virgibacillus phasianinus TaxID=2017483 RepID=A0A220U4N7_9BACI|nr:kinase-associated lipoprotein B [Virgibacillus phasianinus]ASK62876.1 kinase [Virgibacillus phasianinus]